MTPIDGDAVKRARAMPGYGVMTQTSLMREAQMVDAAFARPEIPDPIKEQA